jgi:hypothetical protein
LTVTAVPLVISASQHEIDSCAVLVMP